MRQKCETLLPLSRAPITPRYLTKTRFKQALECPTKLFYTSHPEYLDNAADDSFLAALAEGGYQVGALACAMFPDGVTVDDTEHRAALDRTQELLQAPMATIFEAAIVSNGLFARVDILRRHGDVLELIEVKAKSFNPKQDGDFRGAKGKLPPEWLPYLQDVAFQCHVARLAFPQYAVRGFLMLADKSATASVDGLNQRFRVARQGRRIRVEVAQGSDVAAIGAPVLVRVAVDDAIAEILAGTVDVGAEKLPFAEAIEVLAAAYRDNRRLISAPGSACGSCQFKAASLPVAGEPRSGFHECWSAAFGWTAADFATGTVLDIWNLRNKGELIAQGVLSPDALTLADLEHDGDDPGIDGMTRRHRQWYQCHGGWPGGGDFFLDVGGMMQAMRKWRYPLHFIDFETCAVAIPFARGHRPCETIAFQFSHHVMHEDGRIEHRSQFLEATPGADPCLPFLRALRAALTGDDGTVFRWAAHENTVLNQLRQRLLAEPEGPKDAPDLVAFIESITTRKGDGAEVCGSRSMVDLCKLAERHFFHPATQGSSSLKKVLPALMRSSPLLREIYGSPVYGSAEMPSLNFTEPMRWWVDDGTGVRDPYDLLPPVFDDVDSLELAQALYGLPRDLQEGGAAMATYGRLQFEALKPAQRSAIEQALLRYCELDTLAMVMAVQAWKHGAGSDRLTSSAAVQTVSG